MTARKEEFPAWAPPDLIAEWNTKDEPPEISPPSADPFEMRLIVPVTNANIREEALALLWKFITDERMAKVWSNLTDRDEKIGRNRRTGISVYFMAQAAISGWKFRPKHTRSEKKARLNTISEAAAKLAGLLQDSFYLTRAPIDELLNDNEVLAVGRAFNGPLPEDREKAVNWIRFALMEQLPPMEILLARIAELATAHGDQPELVNQPNANNAHVHYFVRDMSAYFRRAYGQPLHELVATITSIALDVEISKDDVRALVKGSSHGSFDVAAVRERLSFSDENEAGSEGSPANNS